MNKTIETNLDSGHVKTYNWLWNSVRRTVWDSVWNSIGLAARNSVRDFIGKSAVNSVRVALMETIYEMNKRDND